MPSAPHSAMVHSIWQVDRATPFYKEHIIPKGVVEVIFNFADRFSITAQLESLKCSLPNCFLSGFYTSPIQIQLPDQQLFFGVRLQPLAVKKIFGAPTCEFPEIPVDLTLVDKSISSLWHQLGEQIGFNERATIFLEWIYKKCADWQPRELMINNFLCGVDQHDLTVKELANGLCYSPRQLSRKIVEATGLNTEEMLLYKKYLHAVHLIHHTELSLTEIAYKSNFSDQSHFIKSFKSYTRMTPGEYRKTKSAIKGHIFEDVR